MRTIKLVRGQQYVRDGVKFDRDIPRTVDNLLAAALLETGSFQEVDLEEDGILEGIAEGAPFRDYIVNPANTIGSDDLNGKRVLIRRSGGIGDIVFAAVMVQYIKSQFPQSHITFAVPEGLRKFANIFGAPDEVVSYDESTKIDLMHSHHYVIPFNGVLGAESTARRDDVDYFYAHWERAGLSGKPLEKFPPLNLAGLITDLETSATANELLRSVGVGDDPYVVLHLGTSNPLKRMHPSQLQSIAERLASPSNRREGRTRFHVICIGGPDDRVFNSQSAWVTCHSGLDLKVCAELIRRSSCVIGADTGLLQLAAAAAIPTVSIWGPTRPDLSAHHFSGPMRTLTAEGKIHCAPCMQLRTSHCQYYNSGYTECMKLANVEEIAAAVQQLYKDNPDHVQKRASVEEAIESLPVSRRYRVAVLIDNANQYTGGGYYAWTIAKLIAGRPMTHVTVVTDSPPTDFVYTRGDKFPAADRLAVVYHAGDIREWDSKSHYDLVVGTPPLTGGAAVSYAKRTGCKSALLVYETPNYIKEYREGLDAKDPYWSDYKKALEECNFVWVISKQVRAAFNEWCKKRPRRRNPNSQKYPAEILTPSINTEVADEFIKHGAPIYVNKQDVIVMISRNVQYKRLRETIHTIGETFQNQFSRPVELHVIGHNVSKLKKAVLGSWKCEVKFHENMDEREKWALLNKAKVVVHPSDFEGFGIPVYEGLYSGARVIAHGLPVYKDHVSEGDVMYYTDESSLCERLNEAFAAWDSINDIEEDDLGLEGEHIDAQMRRKRVNAEHGNAAASQRIANVLKPEIARVVKRTVEQVDTTPRASDIRLALVTPWNTRCGIAETTREFAMRLNVPYRVFSYTDLQTIRQDGGEVIRCWNRTFKDPSGLLRALRDYQPNVVHFEHEHSLFSTQPDPSKFFELIRTLRADGIRVVVTLHTYLATKFVDDLREVCDVVLCTKPQEEMNDSTFTFIPLPVEQITHEGREEARRQLNIPQQHFVAGSFGMWQEHKGFRPFLKSYNEVTMRSGVPVTYLISGSAARKSQYLAETRHENEKLINAGRVIIYDDYPELPEVVKRLSACDVLVYNYDTPHYSSSSAAIRTGMLAGAPIICTDCTMFSEFEHEKHVLKIPYNSTDPRALVDALERLRTDKELCKRLVANTTLYVQESNPINIAMLHEEVYRRSVYGEQDAEAPVEEEQEEELLVS